MFPSTPLRSAAGAGAGVCAAGGRRCCVERASPAFVPAIGCDTSSPRTRARQGPRRTTETFPRESAAYGLLLLVNVAWFSYRPSSTSRDDRRYAIRTSALREYSRAAALRAAHLRHHGPRRVGARLRRAVHVALEIVTAVFTGEEEIAHGQRLLTPAMVVHWPGL